MVFLLNFYVDGLTEEEQYQVEKKINLIKDHVYPELVVDGSYCHRENNVRISQKIMDESVALKLFQLLCNVKVSKAYDSYYETGVDSHLTVGLEFCADFPLD